MRKLFLFIGCLILSPHALSAEETPTSASAEDMRWAGNQEMNGYRLRSFGDFAKDWRLVTVRFREDTGEFRFIYANPIAWKALKKQKGEYPDGAVFAKSAYLLSHDPSFTSSLQPNKVARYQLMVRDEKKFKETNGWGYALFDPAGRTFPGEPKAVSRACAACHQIVQGKGHVFAEPFGETTALTNAGAQPKYETVEYSKLPQLVVAQLPKDKKTVRMITGILRENQFYGTLDEIRPFLAAEVRRAEMPAVLLSTDGKRFSIVYADKAGECRSNSSKGIAMISVMTTTAAKPFGNETAYVQTNGDSARPASHEFCFAH